MMTRLLLPALIMVAGVANASLGAPPSAFEAEAAIAYSQAAIGRPIGDVTLRDSDGTAVSLSDFAGQPLVVNMVYTACAESCPLVIQTLYDAVEVAEDTLGPKQFSVVTIGFDTQSDTPSRMRAYARDQGVERSDWYFLSGDEATVSVLAETLGFIYFPSPRGFDHLAQTSVIDAEGRVFRQVYGPDFEAPALVEPLLALVYSTGAEAGIVTDIINKVRLFCTFYDPSTERYRFDYGIFISIAIGGASLLMIGFILVRAWRRLPPPSGHA
jgi:protein SCO1/2